MNVGRMRTLKAKHIQASLTIPPSSSVANVLEGLGFLIAFFPRAIIKLNRVDLPSVRRGTS